MKMVSRPMKLFGLLVLAACTFATAASADTFGFTFDFFNPSGPAHTGSGTLTATFDSGNQYTVTAITGTTSAYGAITGLLPPNTYGGNDNLLFFPTPPYLDFNGISFTVAGSGDDGAHDVKVFYDASPTIYDPNGYSENDPFVGFGPFTLTRASTVPEPATVSLVLLAGFLAVGLVRRKRTAPAR